MVKILPRSVGKMRNLQLLSLADTQVQELPFKIRGLLSLRHFFYFSWDKSFHKDLNSLHGIRIPRGIGCLENLQTLNNVEVREGLEVINELQKLTQLRSLSVSKLTTETVQPLCAAISKMNHLDFLVLSLICEDHVLDLNYISSPPSFLRCLFLRGPLQKFPHWISSLHNLLELKLHQSKLLDGHLRILESLPNLSLMFLEQAYEGEELYFEEGSFQKLKVLLLSNLTELKVVRIDKGAMPYLEMSSIGNCPMKRMPFEIEHLANLKALRLYDMPKEIQQSVNPDRGQDTLHQLVLGTQTPTEVSQHRSSVLQTLSIFVVPTI